MASNLIDHLGRYTPRQELLVRYLRVLNKGSILDGGEVHHILPKSLFPEFSCSTHNLVRLSHRAHFIAHMLLWKITGTKEMMFAFNSMSCTKGVKKTSRFYSNAKEEFKKEIGKISSERLRVNNPMFREEVRNKLSARNRGKIISEEQKSILSKIAKDKYSRGWAPRVGAICSEETKRQISLANTGNNAGGLNPFYGKRHSKESIAVMSEKKKGLMPWETNRFKRESVPFYLNADKLYLGYCSGLTGVKLCRSVFEDDEFESHTRNIVGWFKKGWIPSECHKWNEWRDTNGLPEA